MIKALFSFYLDPDLKVQALKRAQEEGRSLSNLLEIALRQYVNPSQGAKVTVIATPSRKKGLSGLLEDHPSGTFTARIKKFDPKLQRFTLEEPDPETGRSEFTVADIVSIHLI